MITKKHSIAITALAFVGSFFAPASQSQTTTYSEDFTGATTNNQWNFLYGACLTALSSDTTISVTDSNNVTTTTPIPSCKSKLLSYYSQASDHDTYLSGGDSGYLGGSSAPSTTANQVADPANKGALRFTNGAPYGHFERGAIVSNFTQPSNQGIQVTFKTVTYRGDSGGGDGADGISFFLLDGSKSPSIGANGGSLAYSCSNATSNIPYDGAAFGYLGLGIDEYGNFLNGNSLMSGYIGTNVATGDNTAFGYGFKGGRIGLRGAGNVTFTSLTAAYGANPNNPAKPYYPASLATIYDGSGRPYSQVAVQNTCKNGTLYNYASATNPTSAGTATLANSVNTAGILDYAPIPNAYTELAGVKIANEAALTRNAATPIFYNLKITPDGYLSLSYSLAGGAYQSIIKNQNITTANGPLPSSFRFGFAGSTGGSTNIHEIMCFKTTPSSASGSSTTVNEKQAAKVEAGTQAYFAFYNPNDWTGKITANKLIDTAGTVSVNTVAKWDASCVLTGTSSGSPANGGTGGCATTGLSGPTAAQSPSNRVMLTWSGSVGIPFQWTNLTTSQQNMLDAGDVSKTANRLNYLRGDRTNEVNSAGVGLYRARDSVLGDIVDSSPTWVGPPSSPYTARWADRLNASASLPENSGQSYASFVTNSYSRLNVVYAGANDGFLHGFRAGSFISSNQFVDDTTNDGAEVLAYMPGSTLQSAASTSTSLNCSNSPTTQTVAQNIHGVTPAIGSSSLCVNPTLDLTNVQYGHNFFVDASPGTGDLFYNGAWHTWLVGGLGAGGAAIYALDVTNPSSTVFTESNAANLVIGEWNAATISCVNASGCGSNLGNTYGTPQIRRLHNDKWGVIFGNGFGSSSGDAGIYIGLVEPTTGKLSSFYYLSTGKSGSNGIAYVTPADLDGDHITDFVYVGDLKGNVWRFDLTDSNAGNWKAMSDPLFTTSGQPITSQLLAITAAAPGGQRMLIEFGTGQRTQLTNTSPVAYASGSQSLYGIWDWNLSGWNTQSPASHYLFLSTAASGLTSPYTLTQSKLQVQTFTIVANGTRDGTNTAVCWQGTSGCTSGSFGWYANLPGGSEQVIFNPVFYQGAFTVNTTVPANNIATSCTTNNDTGFSYVISVANGGVFANVFPKNNDANAAAIETEATGSPYIVTTIEGTTNIVYQTNTGKPGADQIKVPSNTKAKRLTWVQLR